MFLPTNVTNRRQFLERSVLGAGSLLFAPLLLDSCIDHIIPNPPTNPTNPPQVPSANSGTDWNEDAKNTVATFLQLVPDAGGFLGSLVSIFWPDNQLSVWDQVRAQVEALINQKIVENDYNLAKGKLDSLHVNINDYLNAIINQGDVMGAWRSLHKEFVGSQHLFTVSGEELLLLPFFTQFANMFLGLLRDAALHGSDWGMASEDVAQATQDIKDYSQGAVGYVNYWYNNGRANVVNKTVKNDHLCEPFRSINKYDRGMTLLVLDFMTIWPYFDVTQYPNGTNVVLTREIYSDPFGTTGESGDIVIVTPVPTQLPTDLWVWAGLQIDAFQLTYPAGSGPGGVTQTLRMGDQDGGSLQIPGGDTLTLSPDNPITQFRVVTGGLLMNSPIVSADYGPFVFAMQFGFYDGTLTRLLGGLRLPSDYETNNYFADTGMVGYGNEALSSIHVNGLNKAAGSADGIVLGFKHWQPPK